MRNHESDQAITEFGTASFNKGILDDDPRRENEDAIYYDQTSGHSTGAIGRVIIKNGKKFLLYASHAANALVKKSTVKDDRTAIVVKV